MALWLLVVAGAFGGVAAALRPTAASLPGPGAGRGEVPAEVVGFAELAARQWVGRARDGAPDLTITAAGTDGAPGVTAAGPSTAVAVRQVSAGYWAVTVALEVVDRDDAGGATPALWFVEVGVARDVAGRLGLSATPALVPGPAVAEAPQLAGSLWRVPARDDPVSDAVASFMAALLTGTADVSRYLAPGVEMRPIEPAPFVTTSVARLAVDERSATDVRARALIEGRTAGGAVVFVAYELDLQERAGRWEIAAVSGAPALSNRRGPAVTTTSTTVPAEPGA